MNIGAQRFTTKARTWLVIAVLTALLIGIGALIGGAFLYVFARDRSRMRSKRSNAARRASLDVNPATASLYIVNPLRRQGVATLFSTHPPVAERVRRLRALDGDQTFRLVA